MIVKIKLLLIDVCTMKKRIISLLMLSIIALALVGFAQCSCPVAIDDEATSYDGLPITVYVLLNDVDADGDLLWLHSFTQPENGAVTPGNWTDNRLTYIPDAEFCGQDSFNYIATDGDCESNVATVKITVECPCIPTASDVCVCEGMTGDEICSIITDCADCGNCEGYPRVNCSEVFINRTTGVVPTMPSAGNYPFRVWCMSLVGPSVYADGIISVRPNNICEFSDNFITGDLYIGKELTDGNVTAEIAGDELEVTFDLRGTDYYLDETQVWVGTTPPPCNPGKSRGYVADENLDREQFWTMYVPLTEDLECGDDLYIGAHLKTTDDETGWASFGECIPDCKANNWAYCMVKTVDCDCTCDCDPEGCQI